MAKVIYSCGLWNSDLDRIIYSLPEIENFAGKSILITGANGLICSSIIDLLIRWNETHSKKISIIAAARSIEKIRARFGNFADRDYFTCINYDASRENYLPPKIEYIIHGASNAFPAAFMNEPVETIMSNITGLRNLLEYSRKNQTKRVLYISSSEVYGQRAGNNFLPFTETDYGYINFLSARSCYPMSKRVSESLCASYMSEYNIDSVIARPGHVYGPTASESDNRVASSFAYLAALGENIIMKSDGLQLRSWCYSPDCAGAILTIMLKGESIQAYNIPGTILTIREIAEILAAQGGVKLLREEISEGKQKAFNPMNNSSLDGSKLEVLGWKNLFDAKTGFSHTVEILKAKLL